jgi:hypothetical protein
VYNSEARARSVLMNFREVRELQRQGFGLVRIP